MSEIDEDLKRPKRGQFLFAVFFFAVAALLAALLWDQTVWKQGKDLFSQARFWPAVGVFGMVGFTALHIWHLPRRRFSKPDWVEARTWLSVFEFAAWFLVYVWLVPVIGYLPVTMVFAAMLTWRMGYRSRKMLWISVIFAVLVVLVFKSLLQVKIPGAALYEFAPAALRNFLILYL
ncbi:tripartite tricarboxylate transporter TctB family protein [Marimonas arenosa]|uniref:Tripartite tricarboxylate transporter TctB family protein n=1 Tax=Marimonas arenosa TaxID=1795305 RepID=A0AAE3WEW7_9RHOB|nr:tripartite tricarboxylate transporter TctB family protein [Marimonas arenosa]MDQ2091751.1 tripartite tricarboxylate transporter TctB family protein [Marimonas arenosa]